MRNDYIMAAAAAANEVKIKNIQVKKLFDRLDYNIDINVDHCVSILSAPNGCGKTTIFKMLDFIFNPKMKTFAEIKYIPFESFACGLTNGYTLSLYRELAKSPKKGSAKERDASRRKLADMFLECDCDLVFSITDPNNKTKKISCRETAVEEGNDYLNYDYYDDDDTAEINHLNRMGMLMSKRFFSLINSAVAEHKCITDLDFIVANRLQREYVLRNKRLPAERGISDGSEKVDYMQLACDEMVTNIISWRDRYNSLSEIAKSRLPSMYVAAADDSDISFEQFEERWNGYHEELRKFYELGILEEREAIIEADRLKDAFERKRTFLITYLDAFEGTLAPLQENYDKLKLFADIFHKRNEITQKRIRFTPAGIEIFSHGKKIDMAYMSSGEKNDFVMFYRLIFDTSVNGIVLIDEPEISLHIEWQEEYLDRLINICEMNKLQAIVATHSPNIVNDHFDLFVDKR